MTLAVFTTAQILAQLDSQNHWTGSTITYSTSSTTNLIGHVSSGRDYTLETTTFTTLNGTQANAAALAMTLWGDLIAPSFVAVNEAGGTNADIDFAAFRDSPSNGNYAYTLPFASVNPDGVTGTLTKASIWVNDSFNAANGYVSGDLSNPVVGNYAFQTYVHELGHALGLNHMGNYNGNAGSGPSSYQDSLVYSVMSYYGPNSALGGQALGVAWADWGTYLPQTPMLDDVLAIQSIYGVSTTARTGNSTYGFHSTLAGVDGGIYDFTQNAHPIMCIFDSSGNDTLDLSGDTHNDVIDLHAGSFSSVMGLTNNVSIAYSTTIEMAVGGSGNDTLIAGNAGSSLIGGGGADTITGGAGNDLIEGGAGGDYMNGGTGINTLSYYGSAQAVVVYMYTTNAASGGDALGDTFSNFQNFYGSNNGNDLVLGTNDDNLIAGFGGDDYLYGLGGNDTLLGGNGNDLLEGGTGADYLDGGAGNNTLSYFNSTVGVIVNLSNGYAAGGDAAGDTILNFQNIYGSNSAGDYLVGTAGTNVIAGLGGNDMMDGGGGYDYFLGGAGNDTVVITAADKAIGFWSQFADFTHGQDHVQIASSVANFAALTFTQSGNNTLVHIGSDIVQLDNISAASMTAADFVFV